MGWHYYAIRSWDIATGRSNLFSIAGKWKTLRYFIVLYIVRVAGQIFELSGKQYLMRTSERYTQYTIRMNADSVAPALQGSHMWTLHVAITYNCFESDDNVVNNAVRYIEQYGKDSKVRTIKRRLLNT